MIQDSDLHELRQKLEAELARLQGHMAGDTAKKGRRDGANLDRDDLAHNFASQERHHALQDVEKARLTQITEALERMTDGSYGTCTNCGKTIAPGRLKIIPYAKLCIHCQQEQDKN